LAGSPSNSRLRSSMANYGGVEWWVAETCRNDSSLRRLSALLEEHVWSVEPGSMRRFNQGFSTKQGAWKSRRRLMEGQGPQAGGGAALKLEPMRPGADRGMGPPYGHETSDKATP
jgi:hypothetical protein